MNTFEEMQVSIEEQSTDLLLKIQNPQKVRLGKHQQVLMMIWAASSGHAIIGEFDGLLNEFGLLEVENVDVPDLCEVVADPQTPGCPELVEELNKIENEE